LFDLLMDRFEQIEGLLAGQQGADIFLEGLLFRVCDRVIGLAVVGINHKWQCLHPPPSNQCATIQRRRTAGQMTIGGGWSRNLLPATLKGIGKNVAFVSLWIAIEE
jgi:hypothetical protein